MTIPTAVLGGVSIILFGLIAAQGFRMFVEHQIDFANKRNMMIAAVILVTGIGGYKISFAGIQFLENITIDNIALATFLGIFLHAILPDQVVANGAILEEPKQIA
jgi:uracil permease